MLSGQAPATLALDTPARLRGALSNRPAVARPLASPVPRASTASARRPGHTRSVTTALAEIRVGLRQGDRLIMVTGDSGTGKTTVCRALIEEAERLTFTSVMLQPPATAEDLLAQFLRDVGVLDGRTASVLMTRSTLLLALQRFLESLIPIGARAVLVIDEAQHLTPAVLEQLRLALNFETADAALLQVVLAGQPELRTLFQWPELRRVAQRVSRHCELTGLDPDELPGFIAESLDRCAPGSPLGCDPKAVRRIAELSGGIPRLADRLCAHACELAVSRNLRVIDQGIVSAAARRLDLLPDRPRREMRRRAGVVAAAAAACVLLAGGTWAWASRGGTVAPVGEAGLQPAAGTLAAGAGTAAAVETAGGLTVSVATFRTESRARAVAAQLVDEGFPAFTRNPGGSGAYQVIVGPYISAEEAVAAQRSLAHKGVAGTEVRIETADLSRAAWR